MSFGAAYRMGRGIATLALLGHTPGSGTPGLRDDALPDRLDYRDDGCTVAPSCLNCPLPKCRYDVRGGAAAMERDTRNLEIIASHRQGATVNALAQRFSLSRREVFRVLEKGR